MDLNSPPVYAQGYLVKDEPAVLAVTLHPSLGIQAWQENPVLAIAGLEFESEVSGPEAVWSLTDLDVEDVLLNNTSHRVRFAVLYAGMSVVAGQLKVLSQGTGLENPGLQGVRVVVGPSVPNNTINWIYKNGSYPTLSAVKPVGVERVNAVGPTEPTAIPGWIGAGASQIPLFYDWAPLL